MSEYLVKSLSEMFLSLETPVAVGSFDGGGLEKIMTLCCRKSVSFIHRNALVFRNNTILKFTVKRIFLSERKSFLFYSF